jgi:hypothetical protein
MSVIWEGFSPSLEIQVEICECGAPAEIGSPFCRECKREIDADGYYSDPVNDYRRV